MAANTRSQAKKALEKEAVEDKSEPQENAEGNISRAQPSVPHLLTHFFFSIFQNLHPARNDAKGLEEKQTNGGRARRVGAEDLLQPLPQNVVVSPDEAEDVIAVIDAVPAEAVDVIAGPHPRPRINVGKPKVANVAGEQHPRLQTNAVVPAEAVDVMDVTVAAVPVEAVDETVGEGHIWT